MTRVLYAALAMLVAATGARADVAPPPLGAGIRPGSVRLPPPELAPPAPDEPIVRTPQSSAPEATKPATPADHPDAGGPAPDAAPRKPR